MASPLPQENADETNKIHFRFCRECSNMLYPKEDKLSNTLIYACQTCQFSEPATSSCVFRNELTNTVGETAGITQDVGSDPTVGDTNDSPQTLVNLCTMCGQEITCETCGSPDGVEGMTLIVNDSDMMLGEGEDGDDFDAEEEGIDARTKDNTPEREADEFFGQHSD